MTHRLYTTRVSDDAIQSQEPSAQARLEALAGLNALGAVETTGQQPADLRLDGQYRGEYAEMLRTELRELASSPTKDALAWYDTDANTTDPDAGYYTTKSTSGGRLRPQATAITTFDVSLTRAATRGSHRRAVRIDPKERPHPFGNDTTELVGIPATAGKVQWLSRERTATAAATPTDTVTAEFGGVDRYDVTTSPAAVGDRPYLVYDLPLAESGAVDVHVYDTYGRAEIDADGDFAWQEVHRSDHVPRGVLVVETGRLRLRLNEATGLTAERYSAGSWSTVSLGTSDWQLFDVALRRPGAAQVRARLTFEDTASGELFELAAVLSRGRDDALLYSPSGVQVPSGLVTRLTPIAATTVLDLQPERTLIERSELR